MSVRLQMLKNYICKQKRKRKKKTQCLTPVMHWLCEYLTSVFSWNQDMCCANVEELNCVKWRDDDGLMSTQGREGDYFHHLAFSQISYTDFFSAHLFILGKGQSVITHSPLLFNLVEFWQGILKGWDWPHATLFVYIYIILLFILSVFVTLCCIIIQPAEKEGCYLLQWVQGH